MIQAICYIISFVIITIATFIFIAVNCKTSKISIELQQSNTFAGSNKWKHVAHFFSILALILYSIFCLYSSLNELAFSGVNLSDYVSCNTLSKLSLSLYHTSNYILYCVIISYWLHLYYGSEFYTSSTKKLNILIWCLMVIQWFYAITFDIIFVGSRENSDNTYKTCNDIDIYAFPASFGIIQIIIDIILCLLFLIIFYIPFRSILHYGANSAATFDQVTVMLIPKLFNFVSIIITSHILLLILSIIENTLWLIVFDILINGLCLILMAIPFHKYYERICYCYIQCIKNKIYNKSTVQLSALSEPTFNMDVIATYNDDDDDTTISLIQ